MPKIVVASHGSPDYLIDLVADGMVRLLGRENVFVDFRMWNRTGMYFPMLFSTDSPNAFQLQDADALVMSNRCPLSLAQEWMRTTGKKKVAFIDGEDDDTLRPCANAAVYFKREFFSERTYPANVKPLPFAAVPEDLPVPHNRHLPLLFHASFSSPIRHQIVTLLRDMDLPVVIGSVPKEQYNSLLSSSTLGISARGAGWDTYRYWEIPYFGCALLSERLPIVIPKNFSDGTEAVFYDGIKDFKTKLNRLLESPETMRKIGEAGQKACRERHLSTHRAKTVLEALL